MTPRLASTATLILGALGISGTSLIMAASGNLPITPEVRANYDPDAGDFREDIVSEETKNGIYRRDSHISASVKDGWAVMAHDYCGEVAGRPRFTKYPTSMKYGNMDKKIAPRVKDKVPDGKDITDPSRTDDYLWHAIQRRVLSYLLAPEAP